VETSRQQLQSELSRAGVDFKLEQPLAPMTTWKIGGPAEILVTATDQEQAGNALSLADRFSVPVTFLGGGSNVLINDAGIRGVILKNEIQGIEVVSSDQNTDNIINDQTSGTTPQARLQQVDINEYYDFSELDYDETGAPRVFVTVKSGTSLPFTINNLISQGITGLQWFAGIPGTIGGAVLNNIHGGSHFFSEFIETVTVMDLKGNLRTISKDELGFDYDYSALQDNTRFIISAKLKLYQGDKNRAQQTAILWAQNKKKKQPYNTAGCCFKNILPEEMRRLQLASNSWGYIIDKKLGLKGHSIGGAKISELHAAFIENIGQATSADVLVLLDLIFERSQKILGITPKTELFFLGFEPGTISKFTN